MSRNFDVDDLVAAGAAEFADRSALPVAGTDIDPHTAWPTPTLAQVTGALPFLEALDRKTPPVYRQQERDAVRADQVAQDAGRATVGSPNTAMALAMREIVELEQYGLVQRVKDVDGPVRVRLMQLGERELRHRQLRSMEYARREEAARAQDRYLAYCAVKRERDELRAEVERLRQPWWKRILKRLDA